jgi:hypothetical protein
MGWDWMVASTEPELASVLTARGLSRLHSCETADKMEIIPKPIRERMPQDLLQYVLNRWS